MSAEETLFEIAADGIGWLTFNRPEARNAMTFGMYRRLGEICRKPDPRMRVLVLRGAGDKAFVSGTDISQFRELKTPKGGSDFVVRNYTSADFREGVDAFLAKRKPRWSGK